MSTLKSFLLFSAVCLLSLVFCVIGFSQSPQARVNLTTQPSGNQLQAFEAESESTQSPVVINLQATDPTGKPLENAKIDLTIVTPPKTPWFTTDFPIVEGTKLLDISAIAPKGELKVEQMLPIRGTYQLLVNVSPNSSNAFTPFQQKLTLSVRENWLKYRNFIILAVILLIVGLIGGLTIGVKQKIEPGEVAPTNVRLLLSGLIVVAIAALLFVNISAEIAQSKMSMAMSHPTEHIPKANQSGILQSQGLEARLSGDTKAIVGQAANLRIEVFDATTQEPRNDVMFKIKTTPVEDEWVAFAYEGKADTTGKLKWQQQFFDGAPHKIEVEILPQSNAPEKFIPFVVEREIEVEGVAPPLLTRLISLAYLTSIIAIGFVIGIKLKGIKSGNKHQFSEEI